MKHPPRFYSAFILKIYLLLPAGGVMCLLCRTLLQLLLLLLLHPFYCSLFAIRSRPIFSQGKKTPRIVFPVTINLDPYLPFSHFTLLVPFNAQSFHFFLLHPLPFELHSHRTVFFSLCFQPSRCYTKTRLHARGKPQWA